MPSGLRITVATGFARTGHLFQWDCRRAL